jgi:chaperonin GroEL
MRLDKFDASWLGKAGKVTVGKENTTIIDAKGSEEDLEARVQEIRTQIEESKSPYEIEKLQERLAAFVGGVAIVHVGGNTEVEMKEKKDRVEDALHATRAALEEGILPGGGIALLNASKLLVDQVGTLQGDQQTGYEIIISALERPFYKILENAGLENDAIGDIEERVIEEGDFWFGYNPREEDYFNMFKEGIIDPTKVTRLALENAASVAGTMLITEAVVFKTPSEKENSGNGIDPNMLLG